MSNPPDGTILLYKGDGGLVSGAIAYFTGKNWAHAARYLRGFTWESTYWQDEDGRYQWGIEVTLGCKPADLYLVPREPLTESKSVLATSYFLRQLNARRWYNFLLLMSLAFTYRTRWFWKKIGWVPFSNRFFGTTCSQVVDESFKAQGDDLWPGEPESLTVPGDYVSCPLLEAGA